VHAAATTARTPRFSAEQFSKELPRRHPFGKSMSVPTMRAENDVFGLEMSADSDRDGLLADVRVASAMDQSALMRPGQLLLTAANQQHLAVKQQELAFVQSGEAVHGLLVYREDPPQARFARLELGKYRTLLQNTANSGLNLERFGVDTVRSCSRVS